MLNGRIAEGPTTVYEEAGEELNILSPKQLGHILFDKLGLPPVKKTKTGYSTNAEVLEKLRGQAPVVDAYGDPAVHQALLHLCGGPDQGDRPRWAHPYVLSEYRHRHRAAFLGGAGTKEARSSECRAGGCPAQDVRAWPGKRAGGRGLLRWGSRACWPVSPGTSI